MWAWVLLWVVLVLGAGAVFGLLGLMLWKKAKALIAEIGTSSERLTAVLAQLNDLTDQSNDPRASPR
jgi:ketopantoate reductase